AGAVAAQVESARDHFQGAAVEVVKGAANTAGAGGGAGVGHRAVVVDGSPLRDVGTGSCLMHLPSAVVVDGRAGGELELAVPGAGARPGSRPRVVERAMVQRLGRRAAHVESRSGR